MSAAFSSIRRLSFLSDDDTINQASNMDTYSTSSPPSSANLSHTMTMLFHEDDSNLRGSLIKFNDSSSLSESLQTIKRATFYKADKTSQEEENEKKRSNPFTKKSIQDLISTSFRTNSSKPLSCIVESISIALADPYGESYGCPDKFKSSTDNNAKGINVKDVRDLTYSCSDLSFNPNTCTWIGKATYGCNILIKSNKTSEKVMNSYSGNFMFSVTCQTVQIPASSASSNHNSNLDNGDMKKHYCVDVEAILDGHNDDVRSDYDRQVLKIISNVLTHIGYDISRVLFWLELPEFPEGCRGVAFRTVYQLNAKVR